MGRRGRGGRAVWRDGEREGTTERRREGNTERNTEGESFCRAVLKRAAATETCTETCTQPFWISSQARVPAGFKHIIKRRKRN